MNPTVYEICGLSLDPFGNAWMPAAMNGLYRLSRGQFEFVPMPHLVEADFPLCAIADRQGNLWVGTEVSGLQRWTPRKLITYTAQDGLADDNVRAAIEASDGTIWIGTDKGLTQFKNGRFTNLALDELNRNQVRALAEDSSGGVWVGALDGLACIRAGKPTSYRLPGEWFETKIRALCATRDGAVWVGTVLGLTRLKDGQRRKFTSADGLASQEVRALLEDHSGDLWIGTFGGGLNRLRDGKFTTFTATNGLSNNNVWALYEDSEGALWIGTQNGLTRLKDGVFTVFTTAQGLPENEVNSIVEDSFARLWISHEHGIYWVRKREFEEVASGRTSSVRAVRYTEADGLLSTETNGQQSNPGACRTRDGRLCFATPKGLVVIDPAQVSLDEVPPLTAIEQVRANGQVVFDNSGLVASAAAGAAGVPSRNPSLAKPVEEGAGPHSSRPGNLRFPPGGARVLEFRYTANTFVAPEQARFRYRLLGVDRHWIDGGDPTRNAFYRAGTGGVSV